MTRHDDNRCVMLLVKYPQAGAVKSRLALSIGDVEACEVYRRLVEDMLDMLDEGRWSLEVAIHPVQMREEFGRWLGENREYVGQRGADLGERMRNCFEDAFARGRERIVLIGSDVVGLDRETVEDAFDRLDEFDAVLGPSRDGGYYLIGFRGNSLCKKVFDDMEWGTEMVFEETVEILAAQGVKTGYVHQRQDVDALDDLWEVVLENRERATELSTVEYVLSRGIVSLDGARRKGDADV